MPTLDWQSLNLDQERKEQMQRLFPELFADWELDPSQLKKYFGEYYEGEERYGINRAGKNSAIQVIKHRTSQTLHPDKDSSVDREKTGNIFIEGDNLDALRILQKSYYGKIKMIYLDPPYNTGNDNFVYPDDFSQTQKEYAKASGQVDQDGNLTKDSFWRSNTKDSWKYHSNRLGMMYPRLFLAKNLLKDDGVIFVSIDDNEIHNLKMIMNEIFGEENLYGMLTWIKKTKPWNMWEARFNIQQNIEYVLVYWKKTMTENGRFNLYPLEEKQYWYSDKTWKYRLEEIVQRRNVWNLRRDTMLYPILGISPREWYRRQLSQMRYNELVKNNKIKLVKEKPYEVIYDSDEDNFSFSPFRSHLTEVGTAENGKSELSELLWYEHWFETVKPKNLIKEIIFHTTEKNDIILDFFAWSGTTAHAVMDLNSEDEGKRKFILVQYPEKIENNKSNFDKISDLCKERIRRAGKKIKEEKGLTATTLDIWFKAFVVNESNFKVRRPEEINDQTLISQLDLFTNNTKDGTDKLSMLYELMLKRWIDLNTKVAPSTFEKYSYYYLGDGELVVCLDGKVDQKLMDHIIWLKPQMVVMLDKAFEWNDQLLSNTNLQMKAKEITFQTL